MTVAAWWNADCNVGLAMQTTLGQLVSELVESYERVYGDPELAAVAASVTLDEMFESHLAKRQPADDTVRIRRQR